MKKRFTAAALLAAGTLTLATPASAHHGGEYLVSACDNTGEKTAHMLITTVGQHKTDQQVQEILQKTFQDLMEKHDSNAHLTISPAYVQDLITGFNAASQSILAETELGRSAPMMYLDFHHPLESKQNVGPVSTGCTPKVK